MVTAKESPCSNSPGLEQIPDLPCFPPSTLNSASDLRGLYSGPQDEFGGFSKSIPLYRDISYPTENPYFKSSKFALSNGIRVEKPVDASFAPQKRFLIFDQSGNDTRLFFSPSFSSIFTSKTPTFANIPSEKSNGRLDQQFAMKPIVEEKWDENYLSDGEGEKMLEDSEEIDALLYSDSDDDDDDEVTSTGHTPSEIDEKLLDEEVASCDGYPPKRRRLLNGKYNKSSSFDKESPVKRAISCNYDDDVDHSSYNDDIDSSKRETKVKIRQALKMLENIIPELSNKDPLTIIDKAITYLKSMKDEANSLGFDFSGPGSGSSGSGR